MVTVSIDGRHVRVREGTTVLEAAETLGIEIPTLCHRRELTPYGACRVCTVEIDQGGVTRLQAACSYPVAEGLTVRTNTERVLKGRRMILELLGARCPNTESIKELAKQMGVETPRFRLKDDDCILCGLCVRVCHEVVGAGAIGFSGRGILRKVETPFGADPKACIACGACSYVCPTGSIQMERKRLERLRQLPATERECRYARLGYVSQKSCYNNYDCWCCEVDQLLEERFGTHPAFALRPVRRKEMREVAGFLIAPDRYYHVNHIWAQPLNGKVRVGIDDFAGKLLGEVSDIRIVSQNNAVLGNTEWALECNGYTISMVVPISGTVTLMNQDILHDPPLVGRDPYGRGWLMMFDATNFEQDRAGLMDLPHARNWLQGEAKKLRARCETWLGGQDPQVPIPSDLSRLIPRYYWQEIVAEFLQPSPEPLVAVESEADGETQPAPGFPGRRRQWFERILHPFSH